MEAQPTLQPAGILKGSSEFGPHTPRLFSEIRPDRKINFRNFLRVVSSEVQLEYCTESDQENAAPQNILNNLLIEKGDPRRSIDSDPEQLIVVGKDLDLPPYDPAQHDETFRFPGNLGVVFDESDFMKVIRAPGDLAKVMKAENRRQNTQQLLFAETEEQFELAKEEKEFKAIRAAIHTLDHYIASMDILSQRLTYRRYRTANLSRYLTFPIYAQYLGRTVRKIWGETDAEVHNLADLSTLNSPGPKELYSTSGMHRAIKNNMYNSEEYEHPADAFKFYVDKLIKPYSRAKYEKVKAASMTAAEVRNRHMEMLPVSMQEKIVSEYPEAYQPSIIPAFVKFEEIQPEAA